MRRCTLCGTGNEFQSHFCRQCGTELPAGAPTPPAQAFMTPAAGPAPLRPNPQFGGFLPPPDQTEPQLPSRKATVLVTLFLGLIGLIPSTIHTNRAARMGVDTNRYWKAFGWSMAASLAFGLVIYLTFWAVVVSMLQSAASSSPSSSPSSYESSAPSVVAQVPFPVKPLDLSGNTGPGSASDTSTAFVVTIPTGGKECGRSSAVARSTAAATGNDHTSCPFAEAVRDAYIVGGGIGSSAEVRAYSSVTNQWYSISCAAGSPVRCTGANDALVLVYGNSAVVRAG